MRTASLGIVAAVGLVCVGAANAQAFVSGNELLRQCEEDQRVGVGAAFCTGYVAAVADRANDGLSGDTTRVCLPPTVELGQLVRVVKKYLNDRPTFLHFQAWVLVQGAIQNTYPCSKPQQK